MEASDVKEKLTGIFRQTFSNNTMEISDTMTAKDVAQWDLLTHINLVMAVEKGFGVRFTTREVRSMKNVGDFIKLIQNKAG